MQYKELLSFYTSMSPENGDFALKLKVSGLLVVCNP